MIVSNLGSLLFHHLLQDGNCEPVFLVSWHRTSRRLGSTTRQQQRKSSQQNVTEHLEHPVASIEGAPPLRSGSGSFYRHPCWLTSSACGHFDSLVSEFDQFLLYFSPVHFILRICFMATFLFSISTVPRDIWMMKGFTAVKRLFLFLWRMKNKQTHSLYGLFLSKVISYLM